MTAQGIMNHKNSSNTQFPIPGNNVADFTKAENNAFQSFLSNVGRHSNASEKVVTKTFIKSEAVSDKKMASEQLFTNNNGRRFSIHNTTKNNTSSSKIISSNINEGTTVDEMEKAGMTDETAETDELATTEELTDAAKNELLKTINQTGIEETIISTNEADDILTEAESSLYMKVKELLDNIASSICETLDITKEELIKRMEAMGFGMTDLVNVQVLKQIILDINGTDDPAYFLTNEDAAAALLEISNQINELLTENGLSKEGLNQILESNEFNDFITFYETQSEFQTTSEMNTMEKDGSREASLNTPQDETIPEFKVVRVDENGKEQGGLKQETSSEQEGDSGKQQQDINQSDDANISQAQNFINKAFEVSNLNGGISYSNLEYAEQLNNVAGQILEQIKITIHPTQTSMELMLNPEHLGKVNLSVVSNEGVLTAHFTVQNQLSKESIESNIQILRENLENQGIKVEKIEVTLAEYSFQKGSEPDKGGDKARQQTYKKKGSLFNTDNMFEDIAEETLEDIIFEDRGQNINYTA